MLRAFDAISGIFRWSPGKASKPAQIAAAMLGLAGPILVGAATDHVRIGMGAALGGLALSGGAQGETLRDRVRSLAWAVLAGSAALLLGSSLGRNPVLTASGLPLVGMFAGLVGGISMPMVVLTTQFIVFTAIAVSLGAQDTSPVGAAVLFALGAVWTACIFLALEWGIRLRAGARTGNATPAGAPAPRRPPVSALLRRWRRTLLTLPGWQFAIRSGSCLAAAEAVAWVWPWHHAYWVALTVAITLERRLPAPPTRVLERFVGTGVGVMLAGLLMLWAPPVWALIGMVALLAAARPILRSANYMAYAAIMTPLIILLLDFDQQPSVGILVDRLAGTAVGCGITLTLGYLAWSGYTPAAARSGATESASSRAGSGPGTQA